MYVISASKLLDISSKIFLCAFTRTLFITHFCLYMRLYKIKSCRYWCISFASITAPNSRNNKMFFYNSFGIRHCNTLRQICVPSKLYLTPSFPQNYFPIFHVDILTFLLRYFNFPFCPCHLIILDFS